MDQSSKAVHWSLNRDDKGVAESAVDSNDLGTAHVVHFHMTTLLRFSALLRTKSGVLRLADSTSM